MTSNVAPFMFVLRETSPETYAAMSTEERRQALRNWNAWCDDLTSSGKLQQGSPLYPEVRVVSANGGRAVLDGPFAEAKELIGGFFIVHAADLDEAASLAEGCPNLRYGMEVEVRPVAEACHIARSLGLKTMREASAV